MSPTSRVREHVLKSDWLLLVAPGCIWGASFLFIAEGLEAMGPNAVTFVRILVGFATLAFFPQARRSVDRSLTPKIFLLSIVWLAFPLSMFPYAEQHVSSALTGMLNGANPLFTAMVAFLMTRERPTRGGLIALNVAGPIQQKYGVVPLIWRAQGLAVLFTAPMGVPELLTAEWSLWPILSLLLLGAFGTGIAYVLLAIAAGRIGATRASATTYLMPPVALFLGIVLRDETVALVSIAGGAVCILGAWLMNRARHRPAAEKSL